jgi:hypothetical protein
MRYFKYYFRKNPCSVILVLLCIVLTGMILVWPKIRILTILYIILGIGCCFVTFAGTHKRLNDYLIMVKYPFTHCFWIYQNVKQPRQSGQVSREVYLSQMRQVLEQLPTGTYKTITQSMFTREIWQSTHTVIVKRERAYKKSMNPIVRKIYGDAFRPSKFSKQFYYIEFKRI